MLENEIKKLLKLNNKDLIIRELYKILENLAEKVQSRNEEVNEAEYQYPDYLETYQYLLLDEIKLYNLVADCKDEIMKITNSKKSIGLMQTRLRLLLHQVKMQEKEIAENYKYVGENKFNE